VANDRWWWGEYHNWPYSVDVQFLVQTGPPFFFSYYVWTLPFAVMYLVRSTPWPQLPLVPEQLGAHVNPVQWDAYFGSLPQPVDHTPR
jgi:hypothetical protein